MFKIPLGFARVSLVDKRLVLCLLSALLIFLGVSHAPFFFLFFLIRVPGCFPFVAWSLYLSPLPEDNRGGFNRLFFFFSFFSLRKICPCTFLQCEKTCLQSILFYCRRTKKSYAVKLAFCICKQLLSDWQHEKWEQSCVPETSLMQFKQGQVSSFPSVCVWLTACMS